MMINNIGANLVFGADIKGKNQYFIDAKTNDKVNLSDSIVVKDISGKKSVDLDYVSVGGSVNSDGKIKLKDSHVDDFVKSKGSIELENSKVCKGLLSEDKVFLKNSNVVGTIKAKFVQIENSTVKGFIKADKIVGKDGKRILFPNLRQVIKIIKGIF